MLNEEVKQKLDNLLDKGNDNKNNTKRINRRQDGLVERVRSSRIILTEDNKQVLFG